MELVFDSKKNKEIILDEAKKNCSHISLDLNNKESLLFKGDNFNVLSLLLKDYKGKIDLVYIDPPFNTNQDFKMDDDRANSISYSKEGKIAYSDKMTTEEYLEFIRERLILIHELLSEKGSIYFHIDYKIGHYIKILMDEIFGEKNFKNDIARIKSNPKNFYRKAYGNEKDLILFYAKDYKKNIWNDIKIPLEDEEIISRFSKVDQNGRRYTTIPLHAPGETKGVTGQPWRDMPVPKGRHWRTDPKEFDKLDAEGRIEWSSNGNPRIIKYADEHEGKKIQDIWKFKDPQKPVYPTEKNEQMLEQIIKQSSNEDSIILDCFAGSGTTLNAAYLLNRRWIGVDESDSALKTIQAKEIGDYSFIDIEDNEIRSIEKNKQLNMWDKIIKTTNTIKSVKNAINEF